MFHQLKEPFTDPKVRQAFAYALDRDAWAADVDAGLSIPTLTWIPPGFPGFKEGETRWGYDPDAARQAIAESTYGSVEALPEIDVFGDDGYSKEEWKVIAESRDFGSLPILADALVHRGAQLAVRSGSRVVVNGERGHDPGRGQTERRERRDVEVLPQLSRGFPDDQDPLEARPYLDRVPLDSMVNSPAMMRPMTAAATSISARVYPRSQRTMDFMCVTPGPCGR